eukprot:562375-Prorocentrum_minimum.AAC.5
MAKPIVVQMIGSLTVRVRKKYDSTREQRSEIGESKIGDTNVPTETPASASSAANILKWGPVFKSG